MCSPGLQKTCPGLIYPWFAITSTWTQLTDQLSSVNEINGTKWSKIIDAEIDKLKDVHHRSTPSRLPNQCCANIEVKWQVKGIRGLHRSKHWLLIDLQVDCRAWTAKLHGCLLIIQSDKNVRIGHGGTLLCYWPRYVPLQSYALWS